MYHSPFAVLFSFGLGREIFGPLTRAVFKTPQRHGGIRTAYGMLQNYSLFKLSTQIADLLPVQIQETLPNSGME
jgi:hypothetical protein